MKTSKRYPVEVRERAVRMVLEHEDGYDSQWAAISSVASKLGMTPETLRKWVRRAEIDGGLRSGVTTEERARVKELERENRELRRANEILKAAAAFFGQCQTDRCPVGFARFFGALASAGGLSAMCGPTGSRSFGGCGLIGACR